MGQRQVDGLLTLFAQLFCAELWLSLSVKGALPVSLESVSTFVRSL